jgi:hypothetical protein
MTLPLLDNLLPVPVFTIVHAGFLLVEVWHGLPNARPRVLPPPEMAMIDAEQLWWEFVCNELQKAHTV